MLNKIKLLVNQIERLEDMKDNRETSLDKLVAPVFKAASIYHGQKDNRFVPSIRMVDVRKDHVVVSYYERSGDDFYTEFRIPIWIFESEDPVKAATFWRQSLSKEQETNKLREEKKYLRAQLTKIEKDLKKLEGKS